MVLDSNASQVDFPYEWVITKDQSYTLKSKAENTEWMHSLHGAYSESQFIYGDALRLALSEFVKAEISSKKIKIMSMGLGLGYVELIAVFECLKSNQPFEIVSYELDLQLQDLFKFNCEQGLKYILNLKSTDSNIETHFLSFFMKDYGYEILRQGFDCILDLQNSVILKQALTKTEIINNEQKFNVIFYDAFSSKTQSELWSDEFLNEFILKFSDQDFCVFATYAKVGELKRALKSNNFKFIEKKGFAYKHESCLAIRRI